MAHVKGAQHPARRSSTLLRAGAIGFAAIAVAGFTLLVAGGVASADPAPAPSPIGGNVTTCAGAGLAGEIIINGPDGGSASGPGGSGTVTGVFLDVTINAGFTATGIVVKAGPAANIYKGTFVGPVTIEDMIAPTNPGGQQPAISHWFVCGGESDEETESPSPSETPSETPSESTPGTTTSPPGDDDLPKTGVGLTGLVLTGLALTIGGAALLFFRRKRDGLAGEGPAS